MSRPSNPARGRTNSLDRLQMHSGEKRELDHTRECGCRGAAARNPTQLETVGGTRLRCGVAVAVARVGRPPGAAKTGGTASQGTRGTRKTVERSVQSTRKG